MESAKIVIGCTLAAILYGIVHDQVTTRICVEYFTVFHPPLFGTESPTLLGFGWGIVATWWAGAITGLMLIIVARFGTRALIPACELLRPVFWLMAGMAACAVLFGFLGYFYGTLPSPLPEIIPIDRHQRFLAVWWARTAPLTPADFLAA